MVETRNSKKIKEDQNPRKFYSRFLFKALILAVFCSVVPVFLSQTPELSNQTSLLELLHLILVGIAASYGLFSRRNYDGGGGGTTNNDHKTDHNSYVPKILEAPSSVFNVHHQESESEPSDDSSGDYSKIQTWKNKHHMKIPEIVLSKDHDEEKPLLLPVRSLNHSLRVSDSGGRWEKVRSKRQLLKSLGGDDDDNSDVLPSPIPWSSRSSSSAEIESQPLIKTPANLTSSTSFSSPRKSTPLNEFGAKSAEDIARRHNFHGEFHPPPPPPPPPPLPAFYNNSPARKENPRINRNESRESSHKTKLGNGVFHPPPPPPPPPPVDYYKSPPTKLRVSRKSSDNKTKFDERSSKRNNLKKVWWSDPIVESKEHGIIRQDTEKNSYLGSKITEECENEEQRMIRESEIHENDEVKEKKIIEEEEEEGVCESSNGSDVDKKADEFIAKFREQIRLQRIESIKRSANKISANSSR